MGAGLAAECPQQDGLHVFEDHFFPEIVDPDSGDPLPDGKEGELVLTTLSREALPVIRFRTGDITTIIAEPCPCGRTIRRIRSSSRRTDDMFVVDGVNVFPSEIEAALLAVEGTLPHYQIVLTQEEGRDQMEVQIEVTSQIFSDRVSALENLQSRVAQEIQDSVGVRTKVRLVEPHTIRGSRSKVRRVVDQRRD
jgi:phenylacetate-CoA ligase